MKNVHFGISGAVLTAFLWLSACTGDAPSGAAAGETAQPTLSGQSGVKDESSKPDVVKIAVGSKDHTTLVTALQTANYVDALSNAGPFTVFAPTNAAFNLLPAGTVEGLLKPDKKEALQDRAIFTLISLYTIIFC